jgi:hypothetical protein
MTATADARARADDVERAILDLVLKDGEPVTIVDSPPGAGKTRLVVGVVGAATELGIRAVIAAPRNEQVHDLARRLLELPIGPITVLRSSERPLPADLASNPRINDVTSSAGAMPGPVVGTVKKLGIEGAALAGRFQLLVCDEAYQTPHAEFLPLALLAPQVLLVGDPGQLPPLVTADVALFEAARNKVHWPAPKEILRQRPDVPRFALPATWRFAQDTVDLIQPALYPDLPFDSAVPTTDRTLVLRIAGIGTAIDEALDRIASGETFLMLSLPARAFAPDQIDDELAHTMASVARRLLDRGPQWGGRGPLDDQDIGLGDAHVASGERLRQHLESLGVAPDAQVTTPEVWQGRQRPLMIVKHPLSGAASLSEFGLDPGRLCVLISRHQLACVLVARDGIREALQRHEHDSASRPSGSDNVSWRGWKANLALLDALEAAGRVVPVAIP